MDNFDADNVDNMESIEARAEALANLHGDDPNDPDSWEEALQQAQEEWNDVVLRVDAYPYVFGNLREND